MYAEKYFKLVLKQLEEAIEREKEHIRKAAEKIVEVCCSGNAVYFFGSAHAGILSEEAFYRAGGLAIINPIFAPGLTCQVMPITLSTQIERTPGYGCNIADYYGIKEGDLVFVHSVAGRIPVCIDMAVRSRELGAFVVGIVSMEFAKKSPPIHQSGKLLNDVCDMVIDDGAYFGDAVVEIEGFSQKVAPTSTVLGAALVNSIVAEAAGIFKDKGMILPVLMSANIDEGLEYNRKVFATYKNCIKYL